MTRIGLCSTSDVITFDENGHHVYLSSAGGKDLYNDTQIKVIGSLEAKICTKMLRSLSDKRGANFLAMTLRYGMVKIARLDDAFSEIFKLEASPVRRSITATKRYEKE